MCRFQHGRHLDNSVFLSFWLRDETECVALTWTNQIQISLTHISDDTTPRTPPPPPAHPLLFIFFSFYLCETVFPPRRCDESSSLVSGAQRMQRSPAHCEGRELPIIWLKCGWAAAAAVPVTPFASVNRVVWVEGHNVVGCPAASINRKKKKENEIQHVYQSEFKAKERRTPSQINSCCSCFLRS